VYYENTVEERKKEPNKKSKFIFFYNYTRNL